MIHVITSNNHPSNPQQPIQQPYVKRTSKLLSCKSVSHVPILSFIPHATLGEITRFTARKAMWLLALNRKLETAQDSAEKNQFAGRSLPTSENRILMFQMSQTLHNQVHSTINHAPIGV